MGQREADLAEFDALFLAQFPTVVRTVAYVVGDRRLAEDVAQDAFLQLLRHWEKVHGYDRPDLWVRRVALRQAQHERRRSWRRPAVEASAAMPEATEDHVEGRADVLAAVSRLAPKQRAVVVLFYFEDRPMEEIAAILNCSVSTGWSQLHTARKRLSETLGEVVADDVR